MVNKKRNILMLVSSPFFADRGCHVRIYEEVKALQRAGHKVRLVTYHNGRDLPDLDIVRTITIPWYKKLSPGPSLHKIYLDFFLLLKAFWQMFSFKPDVIHAHLHEGAFVGAILQFLFRKPLVLDFQGSLSGELVDHGLKENGFLNKFVMRLERWINSSARLIFTSSAKAEKMLLDEFSIAPQKVINVPDGIDMERVFIEEGNPLAALGVKKDEKVVVYMGTLNKLEGADLLLKIAKKCCAKSAKLKFLIIGYPNVEHYENMASELGISKQVIFMGRVHYEDTFKYLHASQVAISPKLSATEGNLKLCYYMQCGLPTVVFDNDTNRELLGKSGFYAENENWQEMADVITNLVNEKISYDKNEIRQQVSEKFAMSKLIELIEDGYDKICE